MELKDAPKELGLSSLSKIKSSLERIFGPDWCDLELETISIELGFILDELLIDKICLLKVLHFQSDLFLKDLLFFVHACCVINNEVANFDVLPHLSSLEVALALTEMEQLLGKSETGMSPEVREYVNFVLIEEGYSKVVGPFVKYGPFKLFEGQTEEDTKNKELAISSYINTHARISN